MLCKGGSLGSKKAPSSSGRQKWGGLPCATQERGCRIEPMRLGAALCQELPIRTGGTMLRQTGRMGTALTGSPLLPRAPTGPSTTTVSPCAPKRERRR